MWRKAEESKPKPAPAVAPSPPQVIKTPPAVVPAPKDALETAALAVSHGIKIKGEVSGHGDFFLDGEFEGEIHLADGTFTVGPNARVLGEIEARAVEIRGEVIGALKSCQRVLIRSTGKLTGDMETHGIAVEDGAILHSKVATPRYAAKETKPQEAAEQKVASPTPAEPVTENLDNQPPEESPSELAARAKRAAGSQ